MQQVCLIIPCFNEETRLPGDAILDALAQRPLLSVCFVNDGSTDGTASVLESLQARNPAQVHVLNLSANAGKAEAVRQGVLHTAATGRLGLFGYWDADLSTPLANVDHLLEPFVANPACRLVMGSRVKRLGSRIERRLIRHVTGRVFATFASIILGLPVYDSQCGAKVFRSDLSELLFKDPFVTRWLFDVELLARLRNAIGMQASLDSVYEVPLTVWTEVGGSKLRASHLLSVPFDLLRIHQRYNAKVTNV